MAEQGYDEAMQAVQQQGAPLTVQNIMRALGAIQQQPGYAAQPVAVPVAPGTPAEAAPVSAAPRPVSSRPLQTPAQPNVAAPVTAGTPAPMPSVAAATSSGESDTDYSWLFNALGAGGAGGAFGLPMIRGMAPGGAGGLPATVPNYGLDMMYPGGANPATPSLPGPQDVKQLSGPNANQFIEGSTPKGLGGPPGTKQIEGSNPQDKLTGPDAPKQITKDPGSQSQFPEYDATTPKAQVGEMSIEGLNQRTPAVTPTGTPNAANDAATAIRANLQQRGIDINSLPPAALSRIKDPVFLEQLRRDPALLENFVSLLTKQVVRVPTRSMRVP